MAKETNNVTVKINVKSKVSADLPAESGSALFLNSKGAFTFVPEEMGKKLEKNHMGFIIPRDHEKYMVGYKMAMGVADGISTKRFVQKAGVAMAIEETGRIDIDSAIRKEEEKVAIAKADKSKK